MEESLGKLVLHPPVAEPVTQRERISSVDTLRGFALLGILVMNVTTFATPGVFDFNPTAIGDIGRLNLIAWAVRFVLFDGKMRAVFSMLFGAGVILLTSRLEKRGEASRAADIFTRRNMWLTLFGVLHGYFLWVGDILWNYSPPVSIPLSQTEGSDITDCRDHGIPGSSGLSWRAIRATASSC